MLMTNNQNLLTLCSDETMHDKGINNSAVCISSGCALVWQLATVIAGVDRGSVPRGGMMQQPPGHQN